MEWLCSPFDAPMRRGFSIFRFLPITALLGAVLFTGITGCAPSHEVAANGLIYCSEGTPESFNPQLATSGTTFDASANMLYDRLVMRDETTGSLQPALATSWSVSNQGKTYRFNLRTDVAWHSSTRFQPTRALNSRDVVFSFERQRDSHHAYHSVNGGDYPYFHSSGLADILESVDAIDDHTVQFKLKKTAPYFLTILSMEFASILSAEYAEYLQHHNAMEKIDLEPVGTGPYQLRRFENREFIRYTAHPHYYRGNTTIKNIVFVVTPDPSLRLARLRSGECDVMAQPSPAHLSLIKKDRRLHLQVQPGLNVAYWAFNTKKAPFNDVRVRRALNLAINRNAIIKAVYFNAAQVAKGPLPPTLDGYAPRLAEYDYNPTAAQKMLKEAGVDARQVISIWTLPVSRPYNPNSQKMAEIIQADLRRVGLQTEIVNLEWHEFLRRLRNGEHDSVLLGWSADLNDADNFFTPLLSCAGIAAGTNRSFWCDPHFDALVQLAKNSESDAQRKMAQHEAQYLFRDRAPWATIAHATQYLATRSNIKQVGINSSGTISFYRTEKQL